ncbi:glyoxalase/bleomycin resistance protein/dioxygenase superfamily protein [Haloactinopolyspora alba]|uniref:Glyoxalase/bleomycin resistance protein/dioxygenase superfamily protein n=1 Tax=Haloactinopolyspora alba TaxID=648780 RepID=A0A2P8DY05_9ACTN|nr:VOC family protein [Haloactinopolyspora alba]PSL02115.1 glyoxalase/bleomycin resistance protein/dioxygenase superfamily protein [Haloactinopolyspora alba]
MATTHLTKVGTVGIAVTDQDLALEFYVGTLGFEVRRDVELGPLRWIEVAPPGAITTVAPVPAEIPAGLRFFTPDADAAHAHLRESGADTDPQVLRMDAAPPMFAFRDPDGTTHFVVEEA